MIISAFHFYTVVGFKIGRVSTSISFLNKLVDNSDSDNRFIVFMLTLGVVHKLRLQDEVGRWSKKCPHFVNVHTIENVNAGG